GALAGARRAHGGVLIREHVGIPSGGTAEQPREGADRHADQRRGDPGSRREGAGPAAERQDRRGDDDQHQARRGAPPSLPRRSDRVDELLHERDARRRPAGPPRAVRRSLGPVVVGATGVAAIVLAAWLVGPSFPVPHGPEVLLLNSLGAISEELFFRRLVYGGLVRFGAAIAIGGSALLFATL